MILMRRDSKLVCFLRLSKSGYFSQQILHDHTAECTGKKKRGDEVEANDAEDINFITTRKRVSERLRRWWWKDVLPLCNEEGM